MVQNSDLHFLFPLQTITGECGSWSRKKVWNWWRITRAFLYARPRNISVFESCFSRLSSFVIQQVPKPPSASVSSVQFSSVQSLSRVRLFATLWITARQASLSITNSRSSLKLMSIESVMPSSHLILCRPLLLLPSVFSSIRVFSNESALCIRWPKYWSFSFNISSSSEHPGLILVGSSCSPRDSQEFNSLELERRKC